MTKAKERLFKTWTDVPDRSTLVISVTGTTASKMVLAHLDGIVTLSDDTVVGKVDGILDTVNGKPESISLAVPNIYTIDVILTFITDADATVHAHVEDARGVQFQKPLDTVLKRKKGKAESVTLIVGTKQGKRS